ncbi:MAG: putative ABC transporter permease [Bacteroidales bacterium]|nr:putative ABC transporter permease [Lachnoclostridium sp.]MCM1385000.1 putative ABC transporter permease [Lachnoclostridium sp.]MCM1465888.1 putative ABC transporter permease [Bacteroidales bacterium]
MNFLKKLKQNFIFCGIAGWCMEIIFTALAALRRRDFKLKGTTSLWMFPIYGSIAFLSPIMTLLKKKPAWFRGFTYMALIFSAEYTVGSLLNRLRLCPWDYRRSRFHIKRIIRLDYAPNWFGAGLLFEYLLRRRNRPKRTVS